jgi:hypothetical protein
MDRRDGYHPDHPITCRQVKLLRLAVGILLTVDRPLAALFGSDPNPPTREEYAQLYALLIRVTEQGGTFDLERVCGCCVDNQCECHGTALRPAYGGQPSARPRRKENPPAAPRVPLAAVKATVREGTVWLMTSHRHTADGHTPAPPSLVKVVHVTASGSSFHLASAGSEDGSDMPGGPGIIQWPVAARVGYDAGTGAIRLYGPAGDRSGPWLTLVPACPGAAALPADRGFYRHVIQLELLSRGQVDPAELDSLGAIGYEITDGEWSGSMTTVAVNEQVTAGRMAELLRAQGSDNDFLLPAAEDETDLCACPAPTTSRTFPHRCLACGHRLTGTIGNCQHCADLIALNTDSLWAIAGTDDQTACQEAPDHEHRPVLLLSAGTGEDGTCNCQEPGPGDSDQRTCRNCGYPLSETQRRELARLLGLSTEPSG